MRTGPHGSKATITSTSGKIIAFDFTGDPIESTVVYSLYNNAADFSAGRETNSGQVSRSDFIERVKHWGGTWKPGDP